MLLSFFYDAILFILGLIALPKAIYQMVVYKKYRKSFFKRFGWQFPTIEKKDRMLIWIHTVSVGETKAIAPLAKMLKKGERQPLLLISSTTETGHAEAMRSIPQADYHVYLPFDLGCVICPIVKKTAPDLVILCESDFWFNFLKASKNSEAKIILVNGKISERSRHRFAQFSFFSQRLFSYIDLFCLQNLHYKERFASLGIPEEKLQVTGNIKFDDPHPPLSVEELEQLKKKLFILPEDQVIVLGSSHDPEETMVLDIFKTLMEEFPHLKVILVPRHPERFNEVEGILKKQKIPYLRFSKVDNDNRYGKVILIDTMGLLRQCYQLADVAIVGGSFVTHVGGHNILEPCWYSVPVIFGPHMHSQPELVELAKEYGVGLQVDAQHLKDALCKLLRDPQERKRLGESGKKLIEESRGATQKTFDSLEQTRSIKKRKN